MKKKKGFWALNIGLLYILPWLVGFLLFKVYPFASSLYYSFTNYDLFNGITAYYIPSILGGSIAIAILWRAVFNTDGLINTVITFFGGPKINWMAGANSALFVIVLLRVWQFGSAMVIFLAALKGVSEDLYEAASIDGAGKWTQFFKITVPLITPVIFYNLITQLCQAFQEFNAPFLVTKGGPNGATTLISMLIYNNAFLRHKMGMASAQAWILFLIVMTLTAVAFISQKKWVYYSDEEGR